MVDKVQQTALKNTMATSVGNLAVSAGQMAVLSEQRGAASRREDSRLCRVEAFFSHFVRTLMCRKHKNAALCKN